MVLYVLIADDVLMFAVMTKGKAGVREHERGGEGENQHTTMTSCDAPK